MLAPNLPLCCPEAALIKQRVLDLGEFSWGVAWAESLHCPRGTIDTLVFTSPFGAVLGASALRFWHGEAHIGPDGIEGEGGGSHMLDRG